MPKATTVRDEGASRSFANIDEVRQHDIKVRLARVEGHFRALRRQIETGATCDDLLIQAAAVRSALSSIMAKLVEAHIDGCVKACARTGRGDKALEALKKAIATALRQV